MRTVHRKKKEDARSTSTARDCKEKKERPRDFNFLRSAKQIYSVQNFKYIFVKVLKLLK